MSFALRDFVVVVVVVVVAYLHKWCQVIIGLGNGLAPNGLPGPIPQFRDNLFKTHGYFAIKQNETNISSSTIYLKTNKITNTTRTQILHRVYARHIYITKPQQQTRSNWRHTPPCEILLSHLVVTGPWRNEARNLKTVFCVLWSTSVRSHLGGLEKIIASSLGWLRYCRADNMSALWDHITAFLL